jgi:hypothetical protein
VRDISNPVEVLTWQRSVAVTALESLREYYESITPSGQAAVVMGKIKRIDGVIRGLEIAIEALTPEEGK